MHIGVIFCSCAGQIGEQILLEEIKNSISQEVDWVEEFELLCSNEAQQDFKNLIEKKHPDGLIILACSPHNKGSYLLELAGKVSINPYMVNIVNIREQVAWVTKDKKSATFKSIALLKGAVERLKRQKPLFNLEFFISQNILIVGGGIAGLNAALTMSKAKKRVYLVEKELTLGGKILKYEKLFPDLKCAPCFVHPMVEEVLNSSIDLRLNSEIKELKGYFGNVHARIFTKPTYVNPKKCIGCSACESVCPQGAIILNPMSLPAIAKINKDKCLYFNNQNCDLCLKECPVEGAINFKDKEKEENITFGAVLWATGFKLFDCSIIPQLGYGKYRDIYNSLEFEELINSEGPSKGEILTEKGQNPDAVAIIHCVGSLDEEYEPYCSKICCQYAFKFNRLLRYIFPDLKIIHFVKEIVLPGKKAYELYFKSMKDPLVKIVRYDNIKELSIDKTDKFIITYGNEIYSSDIIVLCPAIQSEKFLYEGNSGIFLTGAVKDAMTVEEAITDAHAVSGKVISQLHEDKIIRNPTIAKIDYNICTGCGICILQCPYKAIELDYNKPKILHSLCEGCGVCVASCPVKALELEGFTSEQINAEIDGILSALRRIEDGCNTF